MDGTSTPGARYADVSARIAGALDLETVPVALAFVDGPPEGVAGFAGSVPSACAFWREAERGVFYAAAADHGNCAIGATVMGSPADGARAGELEAAVETMAACGYLGAEEPAGIPTVRRPSAGIVYGPLAEFPVAADVVLCWLKPSQAMLLQEAGGQARWGDAHVPSGLLGRPGCAALPVALEAATSALSAGCIGMRTFTTLSGDLLLAALPGTRLDDLVPALEAARAANETMQAHYEAHRAAVAARASSGGAAS